MRGRRSRPCLRIPFEHGTPGEGVDLMHEDGASTTFRRPSPSYRPTLLTWRSPDEGKSYNHVEIGPTAGNSSHAPTAAEQRQSSAVRSVRRRIADSGTGVAGAARGDARRADQPDGAANPGTRAGKRRVTRRFQIAAEASRAGTRRSPMWRRSRARSRRMMRPPPLLPSILYRSVGWRRTSRPSGPRRRPTHG
jgi:hypothetical protein